MDCHSYYITKLEKTLGTYKPHHPYYNLMHLHCSLQNLYYPSLILFQMMVIWSSHFVDDRFWIEVFD